jgi:hypothetical protein
LQQGWFGGDYMSIVGECECRYGMTWDSWELQCEESFFAGIKHEFLSSKNSQVKSSIASGKLKYLLVARFNPKPGGFSRAFLP